MVLSGRQLVESLRTQVNEINTQQLHEIIENNPQAIVIDIREVAETNGGSLSNAVLIPRGVLEMKIDSDKSIKARFATLEELTEQPVYLFCRSGARSVLSALSLQSMGFKQVYSVEGGYLAWQAAGYECTN